MELSEYCPQELIGIVMDAISAAQLKQRKARSFREFSKDVSLLLDGIRCAHLVDAFSVSLDSVVSILNNLRQRLPLTAPDIAAVFEETTEQVFFVNVALFQQRRALDDFPIWVNIGNDSTPPFRVCCFSR